MKVQSSKRVYVKVSLDFICEHGMPQPWATCTECMLLPHAMQPVPPAPEPPPTPAPKKRASRAKSPSSKKPRKASAAAARNPTRLPRTEVDPCPELYGTRDLSYEIPETNLRYHVQGADSGWVPISTMPRELRPNGWLYLQTERLLVARCRVKGIGFRDRRWTHEKSETTFDAGPGAVLELYGDDWEYLSIDLGPGGDAEVRGYRYLVTDEDGSVGLAIDEDD